MKCSSAQKHFDEMFMQGQSFSSELVRRHVESCPECMGRYRQWCALAAQLSAMPVVKTPVGLHLRVMERVREEFSRREERRAAPASWGMGLAWSAVVTLFTVAGLAILSSRAGVSGTKQAAATRAVRFEVAFSGARNVAIAGDFNKWDAEQYQLCKTGQDTWEIAITLEPGAYQYQFVIDGKAWRPDPGNPVVVPDGFGGLNSGIEI